MKKNYQKPEIIEEIELDRKVVYASGPDCNPGDPFDPCAGGSSNNG